MSEPLPPEEFYSKHATDQARTRREKAMNTYYRALRDYFLSHVPGDRVLVAGCGHGRDTDYFVDEGFEAVGIDIADDIVDHARQHKDGDFRVMDVRDLDFADDRFDGVWASTSLFFMPPADIADALSECRRVLTGDGVLQANFKEGDGRHEKKQWGDTVIEWRFRDGAIRSMLAEAGFQVASHTTNTSMGDNRFLNYLCKKR